MERADSFSAMHHGQRLFQQYLADMWCKTEKEALDFHRRSQKQDTLRQEVLQGLTDAVAAQNDGRQCEKSIGTKVILPSTFLGKCISSIRYISFL